MNYRRLRIIVFSLFFPVVFLFLGILKALVRHFFIIIFFVSFAYAETPVGGWATWTEMYQDPPGCDNYSIGCYIRERTLPSGSMGCVMTPDWATFIRYDTGSVYVYWNGTNFVYPERMAVCSLAEKNAYLNPPTCTDGIKNGTETGVDCGGSCQPCSDSACPAGQDWVGGCSGTQKYCEGSATYIKASSFLAQIEGVSEWSYFTAIDTNGSSYKCLSTYVKNGKPYVAILSPYNLTLEPSSHSLCISNTVYNALNNTACNAQGAISIGGRNTNIYVNKQTSNPCQKNVNGVYTDCGSDVSYDTSVGQVTQKTGTGETTVTPSGGGSPVPVIGEGSGVGGTGSSVGSKVGGTDGNCYDGIKNGNEITADKGGRCIGITTGTGTEEPPVTWSGLYTGGAGSGRAPFSSSAVSDNSELKTLVSGFLDSMKASSFFSMPSSLFQSFPSGGSPDISFNAGRFGTHTYNFSTAWASIIPLLKGIIIAVFAVVAVKVVVLKGGGG